MRTINELIERRAWHLVDQARATRAAMRGRMERAQRRLLWREDGAEAGQLRAQRTHLKAVRRHDRRVQLWELWRRSGRQLVRDALQPMPAEIEARLYALCLGAQALEQELGDRMRQARGGGLGEYLHLVKLHHLAEVRLERRRAKFAAWREMIRPELVRYLRS